MHAPQRASVLTVTDLAARFETREGHVHAVNGVSFTVRQGEIVGVVGESGCGKSATVRAVMGLLPRSGRVTSGTVMFDGENLLRASKSRLRAMRGESIGFVAQ